MKNKMKEVCELLDIKFRKNFNIKGCEYNPFYINYNGLNDCNGYIDPFTLYRLLTGELSIEKDILTETKKIYSFDFDGTIVTNKFPDIGEPIQETIDLIKDVKAEGHYIILNTMRENESLMRALMFCKSHDIEFDSVNDNLPHMKEFYKNNPRKIFANYYIDDHNLFIDGVNNEK